MPSVIVQPETVHGPAAWPDDMHPLFSAYNLLLPHKTYGLSWFRQPTQRPGSPRDCEPVAGHEGNEPMKTTGSCPEHFRWNARAGIQVDVETFECLAGRNQT